MPRPPRVPTNDLPDALTLGPIPQMSDEMADIYAKLLMVGAPPVMAVRYCSPKLDIDTAKATADRWRSDPRVLHALETRMGGKWIDLPIERRAELALDKQVAEAIFHLWTVNLAGMDDKGGLDKLRFCREIAKSLLGQQPDVTDPMQMFARFSMDLMRNMASAKAIRKAAEDDEHLM